MNALRRVRIIERIRKILRLANDAGATEGERDNDRCDAALSLTGLKCRNTFLPAPVVVSTVCVP